MVERTTLHLGRKSVAALVEHLEARRTWSQLSHLLFENGLDARFIGATKLEALGNVFYPLVREDADEDEMGRARDLFESLSQSWYAIIRAHDEDEFSVPAYAYDRDVKVYQRFQQAMRADGLDLIEGRIAPFLSPSVAPAEEQGILESRLQELGFATSLGHLQQTTDNAARGNWEAANGQVGSFLESLCEEVAARLHAGPGDPPLRGEARKYLEESGFLDKQEADLLRSLFQVLHSAGGRHAGTSNQDDCHRRRLIAFALANYYLDRLTAQNGE